MDIVWYNGTMYQIWFDWLNLLVFDATFSNISAISQRKNNKKNEQLFIKRYRKCIFSWCCIIITKFGTFVSSWYSIFWTNVLVINYKPFSVFNFSWALYTCVYMLYYFRLHNHMYVEQKITTTYIWLCKFVFVN